VRILPARIEALDHYAWKGGGMNLQKPGTDGKVYLIGAGPGDVELLTLKAVRALERADVALVDDLVNREVLQFLRSGVRIIEVGKRGGCRSTPQAFIERQMVLFARQGLTVARVKGGDPFIFGRGGEEMEALHNAGIEVEIVGGITAGIAAPAALGIAVTHRDWSHGVTLLTGHTRDGKPLDWHALARSGTTLVIYMGVASLPHVVAGLRDAGMAPSTPVAVIQHGTLPQQRSLIAQLDDVIAEVAAAELSSPAIIVVGEVVRLAASGIEQSTARQVA
jgi:uroporphyrin-III C-methyltransferase